MRFRDETDEELLRRIRRGYEDTEAESTRTPVEDIPAGRSGHGTHQSADSLRAGVDTPRARGSSTSTQQHVIAGQQRAGRQRDAENGSKSARGGSDRLHRRGQQQRGVRTATPSRRCKDRQRRKVESRQKRTIIGSRRSIKHVCVSALSVRTVDALERLVPCPTAQLPAEALPPSIHCRREKDTHYTDRASLDTSGATEDRDRRTRILC